MIQSIRSILVPVLVPALVACAGFLPLTGSAAESAGSEGVDPVEIPYSIADWPQEYGNHRALIQVATKDDAVWVHLAWRRRDRDAETKNLLLIDPATRLSITNRLAVQFSRESVDLIFQPASGAGLYELYYLPPAKQGLGPGYPHLPYFPITRYAPPENQASRDWLERHHLAQRPLPAKTWQALPKAQATALQALRVTGPDSYRGFNSFHPMEVIATAAETRALIERNPGQPFLIFPEDRRFPIRMQDDLPFRWIQRGLTNRFVGEAKRNEFFTFQLGVYALQDLADLQVSFEPLAGAAGAILPTNLFRCFNLGGTDWLGRAFAKPLEVPKGQVQALWIGIDVPTNAASGRYAGRMLVQARGTRPRSVELQLNLSPQTLADRGDSELWRQSRLRWLDSTIGLDENVIPPFTPITLQGRAFGILGRDLELAGSGLPVRARSRISMTEINETGREILARPIAFVIETDRGPVPWSAGEFRVTHQAPAIVRFESRQVAEGLKLRTVGSLESDGYLRYQMELKATKEVELADVHLDLPIAPAVAKYAMGVFGESGYRPGETNRPIAGGVMRNLFWTGDYNAGIACQLKNDEDEWNADNVTQSTLPIVREWENGGRGRYQIREQPDATVFSAHAGSRSLKPGEIVRYNFALMLTPFKPIRKEHWTYRIYHQSYSGEPSLDRAENARIVNIHHANTLNPYINYPFIAVDKMKPFVDAAHARDLKVKIYYTIRELSVRTAELWALRSLGDEIFIDAEGYEGLSKRPIAYQQDYEQRTGYPWISEHLVNHYRNRWHSTIERRNDPESGRVIGREIDASIATRGLSRWHNYYLEGLAWLRRNVGVDGLYLDGIGYDREIMKRVRRSMMVGNDRGMIDYHGTVSFADLAHAPYLDSIWYGEGADYSRGPDYWLVDISGIPFGLTGEILQGNEHANEHRGMLFGISKRLSWSSRTVPHLWRFWDSFGIADSKQIGFWEPDSPVKTDHRQVLVTVYQKTDQALIALASWVDGETTVQLNIDWNRLGLDPRKVRLQAPEIEGVQPAKTFAVGEKVVVPRNHGWLIQVR